jgi:hypothetical protein
MKTYLVPLAVVPSLFLTAAAASEEPYDACVGKFTFVESKATYEDFDFWTGEWQVVTTEGGELRSYDKIKMIHNGCVMLQEWHQMDDLFSNPEAPVRLRGTSLTGIDASGKWRQLWTDNSGSNMLLTGGLDENGVMTLKSEWIEVPTQNGAKVKVRNLWYWDPQEDGTIHNWGEQQRDSETGPKSKYFDITYHRAVKGGPAFNMRNPKP